MSCIKRYDKLTCEILTDEEIVNTEPEKENKNQMKEDDTIKGEIMKSNEISELIFYKLINF